MPGIDGIPERIASGMTWQRLFTTGGEILGLNTQGELWILRQWAWGSPLNVKFPVRWEGSAAGDVILGPSFAWSIDGEGHLRRWYRDRWAAYRGYYVPLVDGFRRVGRRADWVALGSTFGGNICFGHGSAI